MARRPRETRGRKPVAGTVRVNWCGIKGRTVRFAISEDLVNKLRTMHMAAFSVAYGPATLFGSYNPLLTPRVEFMRFDDLGMNAVMLRIEPPTYDPKGVRLRRDPKGRRWYAEIPAHRLGVHPNMLPREIEYMVDDKNPRALGGGMIFVLPEEVMVPPRSKARSRSRAQPEPAPAPAPEPVVEDWREKWGEYAVDGDDA